RALPCPHSFPTRRSSDLKRKSAFHRAFHQLAGNEHPVDLVRAFENAVDARIAIRFFGRIISGISVTAEDLYHFIDDMIERFAAGDRKSTRLNSSHVKISY